MFSYTSDRYFVVSSYVYGHGLLLFRSSKERNKSRTRIDILIQDVRAVELRFWSQGLTIREADPGFVADTPSKPSILIEAGNRVYAIGGNGWDGFIVGGAVTVIEDEGMATEVSKLIEQHGTI